VLDRPELTAGAQRLGQTLRDEDGPGSAAALVERVSALR
jgi:UDP:flavonoid glycosyltransferase YjiC (YdhE family)